MSSSNAPVCCPERVSRLGPGRVMKSSPAGPTSRRWTWGSRKQKQLECEGGVLTHSRQGENHPEGLERTNLRAHTRLGSVPVPPASRKGKENCIVSGHEVKYSKEFASEMVQSWT